MIDVYCALCGVPVELEYSLYHGRVDEEDVAWTFRLHRLETSTGSFTCHLFCWRNLRQQYDAFFNASQAFHVDLVTNILSNLGESQTTNRLSPNWCNGYEEPLSHIGPANAAMADGWMDFDGADPEHLDFLAVDPARLPDKVLKTLLDASTDTASLAPEDDFIADGRNAGLSKQNADALPPRTVGLERLPIELLKDIFQLLPLESARALRCVSRYFSNITLDGGFWRSRLIYPHELHHFGSTRLGPGPPKGKDLEKVYRALIQPSEPSRHWLNWNRIASNNTRLLQRIQEEHRNPGMDRASTPAQIRDGTSEIQNFEVPGYTAVRRFALRFDEKHPVAAVRKIRLSFVRTEHRYLVSGICFFFENDRLCLGYERGDKYENFEISRPDVFGGFDAELDSYGFYGLHPLKVLQIGGQFSGSKGRAYFDFDPQWLHARFAICPTQDIIGFDVATSVDHRIVSLSLLKSRSENAESGCEANKLSVPSEAWVPSIPPYSLCFGETSRLPADPRTRQLSHFRHVIYATSPSQLLEVRRVSCIFKRVSEHIFRAQLEDFQVHFEEGDSVAHLEDRSTVEMLIDGSAGERIVGVDVLRYSNSDSGCDKLSTPECLGLQIYTNFGRRGNFSSATIDGSQDITRLAPMPRHSIAGLYGKFLTGRGEAFRNLGIAQFHDGFHLPSSSVPDYVTPKADDFLNVWIEGDGPPHCYLQSEMAGMPIYSGFSNWIDFEAPISSVTELWNLKPQSWKLPLLTGLHVIVRGQPNVLLGRWGTMGKSIEFRDDEKITAISVISAHEKQPFNTRSVLGVELETSRNSAVVLGLTGVASQASLKKAKRLNYPKDLSKDCLSLYGKLDPVIGGKRKKRSLDHATYYEYAQRPEAKYLKDCIVFQTTETARLTGLIWTTHTNEEDNTVRALWATPSHDSNLRLHQLLCPSLSWSEDPPPHVQPRPVPNKLCAGSRLVAVPSNAGIEHGKKDIVHIRAYATAVLHGLQFTFANGGVDTLGVQEGTAFDFELHNRRIVSVHVYDLFDPDWIPPDIDVDQTVFVQAMKIGFIDVNDQGSHIMYSALLGAGGVPEYSREEKRDYVPWAERSHKLFPRTRKLELQEGTSFAGLWAEVLPVSTITSLSSSGSH